MRAHQPLRGTPDDRVILRALRLRAIDPDGPQCNGGDLKVIRSHRWAMRCHSPSAFGPLLQSDESRKCVGCGVGRRILRCYSQQHLTHGARLSADADPLPRTLLPLLHVSKDLLLSFARCLLIHLESVLARKRDRGGGECVVMTGNTAGLL